MPKESVAIVGTGAVGQMLLYLLHSAGIPNVVCYSRTGPITLSGRILCKQQLHVFTSDGPSSPPLLWLFATKAYDLVPALYQWLPEMAPHAVLTILSNGYVEPELKAVRQQFPQYELRKGVVSRGVRPLADGTLSLGDSGDIRWGSLNPPSEFELGLMPRLAAQDMIWDPQACAARKEKWFCNTVLNTLCGVYRLACNRDAEQLKEYSALCHEVYNLGCEFWPEWKGQEGYLRSKLQGLIAATAANENSMAVDVRLGRPTEREFLSGRVQCLAEAQQRFPLLTQLHGQLAS